MKFFFKGNNRSTFGRPLANKKGQVALFIALIFQILFLFFAMVINVGLLIHHKINLQNSVDLAAYYGAMKQAENLNAVSHINYQIRQSWKLLTWRYRMVGSAGEWEVHPFDKRNPNGPPRYGDEDNLGTRQTDFFDAPAFCAAYVPFKPMPEAENTCKGMASQAAISLFNPPQVIAGFQSFTRNIQAAAQQYLAQIRERCKIAGTYNYILLGSFVVAYNIDQGDRSLLMTQISRSMSASPEDFWDIDGDSVKEGIKKTLDNNLTIANREGLSEFKVYNSLGAEACNSSGRQSDQPPKWLTPIRVYPAFAYTDTRCDSQNAILSETRALPDFPINMISNSPDDQETIKTLANFIGLRTPLETPYNFSVGVEKNPWCMPYVGVSAKSKPSIPFSIGGITLTAKAFAKPFGGRVGPWYNSRWASGAYASSGGKKIDDQLPPRVTDVNNIGEPNDRKRVPNYSRFVGDLYGLKTRNVHYQYAKAIYELDPRWKSQGLNGVSGQVPQNFADTAPNFKHWTDHLPFKFADKGGNGDLLAWDSNSDGISRMRELELLAVLPDTFDITYYSIEPDFYNNYYKRLQAGFLSKVGKSFDKVMRPDIGYHKGYNKGTVNLENFSVKDQYKVLKERSLEEVDVDNKLTYITKQWDHALTGWVGKDLLDFSLDTSRFGRCTYPLANGGKDLDVPTSGNCVQGGSVGFSVKSVASDYLRSSDLELGGEGGGQGPLMNPPPSDF